MKTILTKNETLSLLREIYGKLAYLDAGPNRYIVVFGMKRILRWAGYTADDIISDTEVDNQRNLSAHS